jgi:two-component system, cell cycle response regulator
MDAEARKPINIAPMNLAPHEEARIRNALQMIGSESDDASRYVLLGNRSAREAHILIANIDTQDLNQTSQILRRVYGVKSTIFIVEDSKPEQGSDYKYVINRRDLDRTLLPLLDTVAREEIDAEYKVKFQSAGPSAPPGGKDAVSENPVKPAKKTVGRVLIVDDSPSVRTQMNLYLNKRNFECHMAQNSEEAIRAIKKAQFDIIFLDVVMPGADGYQACKAIKALEATRSVPVILLTSKNSPIDKIHGIMSGCDKYLTKPLRVTELESLLCSYFPALKASAAGG